MSMQRIKFAGWAQALMFGTAALVPGCVDDDSSASQWRDQAETGGPADADDPSESNDIPGHYIVMLKKGANPQAAVAAVKAKPNMVFSHAISGFAATLNHGQVEALSHHPDVLIIEPDQIVTTAAECPACRPTPITQFKSGAPDYAPSYSVDRVDQRDLPLSYSYTYDCSGDGVNAYVFDTWMDTKHPDLLNRAKRGYDGYPKQPANSQSCSGHATHVAGIIAGTKYGIAKHAKVISVEVLDCTGHGTWSKLLAGIDWVLANKGSTPAVANMSLAGGYSFSVNAAIDKLTANGVFVAVAAGNDDADACWISPAGAQTATVVAASNSADQRASFSNHGPCVDIYAGGTNVRSAWPGGGSATASGTSMATPHVAGVAALYKSTFGDAPASKIEEELESFATANKISSNPANTANLLLYWWCSGSGK
jgi:subtilisin family serine protease